MHSHALAMHSHVLACTRMYSAIGNVTYRWSQGDGRQGRGATGCTAILTVLARGASECGGCGKYGGTTLGRQYGLSAGWSVVTRQPLRAGWALWDGPYPFLPLPPPSQCAWRDGQRPRGDPRRRRGRWGEHMMWRGAWRGAASATSSHQPRGGRRSGVGSEASRVSRRVCGRYASQ